MSVDAKKTKRKNDDDDDDDDTTTNNNDNNNNTTNDDGKMTITQKRTEAGLAQIRKTKQTTLAQSSFPTPKRNKNEKNISPRTTEKNDPPTTTNTTANITKTEINAASALRDLWGCNWAGGDDDDDDDDNAQCLAPALCEDNNNNNESKDSWDFAT